MTICLCIYSKKSNERFCDRKTHGDIYQRAVYDSFYSSRVVIKFVHPGCSATGSQVVLTKIFVSDVTAVKGQKPLFQVGSNRENFVVGETRSIKRV